MKTPTNAAPNTSVTLQTISETGGERMTFRIYSPFTAATTARKLADLFGLTDAKVSKSGRVGAGITRTARVDVPGFCIMVGG